LTQDLLSTAEDITNEHRLLTEEGRKIKAAIEELSRNVTAERIRGDAGQSAIVLTCLSLAFQAFNFSLPRFSLGLGHF
jgi:hypothetical protein